MTTELHHRMRVAAQANATGAVRMVGNSVSPPPLAAIAAANLDCTRALRCAA